MPAIKELPKRLKLSGADCFHVALDRHAQKHSAGGNVVRMAFFLEGKISKESLQSHLDRISVINWMCNIELRSGHYFQIPFWEHTGTDRRVIICEHLSNQVGEIPELIFQRDIPLDAPRFFEADLIHYPNNTSTILFSWNHILLDGRGSGMLMNYMDHPEMKIPVEAFFPTEKKSPGWIQYIRNMYKVKHFIEESTKSNIVSVFSSPKELYAEPLFKRQVLRFDAEETKQLEVNARKNGTRFGVNSFLLAACSKAVSQLLERRGKKGDLWIPVPYDGRKRGSFGPVISNNVSTVFYTIPMDKQKDVPSMVAHLAHQMNQQLKEEMPHRYNLLLDMMRHIPSRLYYYLVARPGEGALSSFLFTATGEGIGDMRSLFGLPLKDVVIYSPETYPPGLTFLFLRFNNQIKVNISYSSHVIQEAEFNTLCSELTEILIRP